MITTGTIIRATHRPQDLIPAFVECLRFTCNRPDLAEDINKDIPKAAIGNDDHPWWGSVECAWILNEDLFELLAAHAPSGYYFGAHEGDGSDFGFWALPSDDCVHW